MDTNMNSTGHFLRKIFQVENLTHTILTLLLIGIPVFFLPSNFVAASVAKSIFISIGIMVALVSYLVFVVRKGTIFLTKSYIFVGFGALLVAYLVSSVFSSSTIGSFLGYGFETGTFVAILLGIVLVYLVSISFNEPKKIFTGHIAFLAVAGALALFQSIVMLFVSSDFLTGNTFLNFILNTIGKTNELAIFFSLSTLMALVGLETLRLNQLYRFILYVILVLSFVVVAIVNFMTIWYVLGTMLLLFFVYQVTFLNGAGSKMTVVSTEGGVGDSETKLQSVRKKMPIKTFVFFLISLVFIVPSFFGGDIGKGLSSRFSFSSLEVRPSWSATHQIFRSTISQSPLVGAGPNRFSTQWQLYRPDVNLTNFWSINFDSGIGFVPTSFVETGILGIVSWFILLISILYVGWRALYVRSADQMTRYLVVSSFVGTLFLWVVVVFYIPGLVIFFLTFFFTGLFISSAISAGVGARNSIVLLGKSKTTFAVVALSVCVLVASIGLGYVLVERTVSSVYFQKANYAANTEGDITKAENLLLRAVAATPHDLYYRMISNLNLLRLNNLLNGAAGKTEVTDAEKAEFQRALQNATEAARLAIERDPVNYENKTIAGQVSEAVIPVQIEGAYETAKNFYEQAVVLSPRNPALFLALARVEAAKNNLSEAESYVKKALELKWNYPDAIFLQSQIDVSKGNIASAIKSVQQIATLTPNDPLVFFRLGLLQYQASNFAQAVVAFEKSISLVPVYANAKYFLGLSYYKVGRVSDAITEFTELKITNPGVAEISLILNNLAQGRDPFTDGTEDTKPEKRKGLPVKEADSSEKP